MTIETLPLWLKLVCCGVLTGCVGLAYVAPPPRRGVAPRTVAALLLGSLAAYTTGVAALIAHRPYWAATLVGLAIVCGALAAWMSRFRSDEGPNARAASPDPPDTPAETDWDRFERAFRESERRRDRDRDRVPA